LLTGRLNAKGVDLDKYNFPQIIKNKRKQKHLTQNELARLLSVSGAYIAKIEKGGQCPSSGFLEKLSSELEIDLYELYIAAQLETNHPVSIKKMMCDLMDNYLQLRNDKTLGRLVDRLASLKGSKRERSFRVINEILALVNEDKVLD
jgi:transcriptional regulator with XRE-family HTH domain